MCAGWDDGGKVVKRPRRQETTAEKEDFGWARDSPEGTETRTSPTWRREDDKYVLIAHKYMYVRASPLGFDHRRVPNVSVRSGQGPRLAALSSASTRRQRLLPLPRSRFRSPRHVSAVSPQTRANVKKKKK